MLVALKDILYLAEAKKCAVGSFNVPNLEAVCAVIDAAESLRQPVILSHAQVHEELGLARLDVIGRVMLMMAERASVPVCVHLDHGESLDYLHRALDLGFTSIMYDGSTLPYAQNVANTRIAVSMAAEYGASVEAEIGSMGTREDGQSGPGGYVYTDPDEAKKFAEETGIDALACAFGTAHGIYKTAPKLDFDRVCRIREKISVPIVMHGGSGVSTEDYKKVIDCGVRKINYFTYMSKAGGTAAASLEDHTFFHDIIRAGQEGMRTDAEKAIRTFARLD